MRAYQLPTWRSGDTLDHAPFNRLSAAIGAAIDLRVDPATGLTLRCDAIGQTLAHARPAPIWGTLSGSTNLYTFTEAIESSSSGAWASGTRTGTAYEVNGVLGLGGKVVRLYPVIRGAWRFQWRPIPGIASCSCSGIPTTLYGGFTYSSNSSSCFPGTMTTLNFTLTYNPATVTISGHGTVSGYWDSGCLANMDNLACACPTLATNGKQCYQRVIFYCRAGAWCVAQRTYDDRTAGVASSACAADTSLTYFEYGSLPIGQCSPFSWKSAGTLSTSSPWIVTS